MADETVAIAGATPTYTREALAASKSYRVHRDVIMTALDANKSYTPAEAKKAINDFLSAPIVEKVNQ